MSKNALPLIASMIASVRVAPIPETQATFVSNLLSSASLSAAELDVGKCQLDKDMGAEATQSGDDTPLYTALTTIGEVLTKKAAEIGYTLDHDDQLSLLDPAFVPGADLQTTGAAARTMNGAGHQRQQGDGTSRPQTDA